MDIYAAFNLLIDEVTIITSKVLDIFEKSSANFSDTRCLNFRIFGQTFGLPHNFRRHSASNNKLRTSATLFLTKERLEPVSKRQFTAMELPSGLCNFAQVGILCLPNCASQ
ncbi:hypothetical protein T10_11634 [Trichinella papuae]|uniref:Uncharacterized protein n=1 Tax=Trichinella papuae TaxID=268474 RepID=A0A0V1LZR3_9BILA|nr:hypothetical protein T10_11634 [Trichinella papuae]